MISLTTYNELCTKLAKAQAELATLREKLAALRAKMDGESTSDVAAFANGTLYWLAEFDATIAKLGLQEQSK